MKWLTLLILAVSAHVPLEGQCALRGGGKHSLQRSWKTKQNKLVYNGQEFRLKGINWNGFESDCNVVHGLWLSPLRHYLDILREQHFNALRIPLSFEIMENLDTAIKVECATADPEIFGKTVRQYLGLFLDHLSARGISALFDLHTIGGNITEMPWADDVGEDRVVAAWVNFAQAFGKHPAIMGLEIKNEPHGPCTTYDFHAHCAKVIGAIGDRYDAIFRG